MDPIKPQLKAPGTKRLKLKYDELLSSFAFNFNLRRYTMNDSRAKEARGKIKALLTANHAWCIHHTMMAEDFKVRRCRLPVSNPVLKAPMVSALGARIGRAAFKLCFQFQLAPLCEGGTRGVARGTE